MKYFLIIILATGLLWLKSSFGKFTSGNFVDGLSGTLNKFASQNPYPLYKSILQNIAIPNSKLIGSWVLWGELFTALAITVSALFILLNVKASKKAALLLIAGLLGGILLNVVFWLAAGWTSPSTDSLNFLMLVIQISGLLFAVNLALKGVR